MRWGSVLFLGLLYLTAPAAADDEAIRVNRYLAGDTLVHLSASDSRAYLDLLARSPLGTLFDEPEVRIFLEELGRGIERELARFEEVFGVRFGDLAGALRGEVTVNLTGLEIGAPDPFVDRLLLTARAEGEDAVLGRLLGRAFSEIERRQPEAETGEYDLGGGALVRWIRAGERTLSWTFLRGTFFVATDQPALNAIVARIHRGKEGGLVENPRYLAAARRTIAGRTGAWLYADVRRILDRLDLVLEPGQKKAIEVLGLDRIEAVGLASTVGEAGAVDRLYVYAPGAKDGIWSILDAQPPYRGEGLDRVPEGAFLVQAGTYDLERFLEQYLELAGRLLPPEEYASVRRGFDSFREYTGFGVPEFFTGVGGEAVFYATLPETGGLMPDIVLLARCAEGGPFPGRLDAFLERATRSGAEEPALDVRTVRFAERTFRYVNLSRSGQQQVVAPAFAFHGSWLVVAQTPNSLKHALLRLDRLGRGPGVSAAPDFARTVALLSPGYRSLGYADLRRGFVGAYDTFVPFFQAVAAKGDVPFEPALLPTGETLERHLFGVAWATYRDPDGFAFELASPVGIAPFLAAVALLGALGEANQGRSLAAAGQGPEAVPSVSFDYRDASLAEALDDLARRSGVAIHFPAEDCRAVRVTASSAEAVPLADAVARVLEGTGFSWRLRQLPDGASQIVVYR